MRIWQEGRVWLQEGQALRQRRPLEEPQSLAQRHAGPSPPAQWLRAPGLRASTSWISAPTLVQVRTIIIAKPRLHRLVKLTASMVGSQR